MHLIRYKSYRETTRSLFLPILTGIVTSQIIATLFVRDSNMDVYELARAATDAGYFVIPVGPATATLTSLNSAIWGGLFFTLSIGVGLTLVTWAALSLWSKFFKRTKWVLITYLIVWAGVVLWINCKGFALYPTLFCLLVPLATGLTTAKGVPTVKVDKREKDLWLIPLVVLVLLTAVWATRLNSNLFITIRDHILLSNPVGSAVNDFYYRYTLYAAESFKSLNQKTVRSYHIEQTSNSRQVQNIVRRLAQWDMLYLPKIKHPDLKLSIDGPHLSVMAASGKQIDTTIKDGLAKPNQWLQQLSEATDRYSPLRRTTLVGLLLGFPILLYMMVYGMVFTITGMLLSRRNATLVTSGLCLVLGLLLFMPMLNSRSVPITEPDISQTLASDQWFHRVAALRYIEKHRLEINRYPQYKPLLRSPRVVERYWLARAMAYSRSPATYSDLKAMLGDPHPNVTCQIFFALGERRKRAAIVSVQNEMALTDHWYAQWYGYRALRRMGWFPKPSN